MKYIIVDLEATCWNTRTSKKNEIIEIGALCIDQEANIESEFQAFVKPLMNPVLSNFCKELTTITQEEIDTAAPFNEVVAQFQEWIQLEEPFFLCSWGFYDKKQFQSDCELHGLSTEWLQNHISLKHQYPQIKNIKRKVGMKAALGIEGFELDGMHHRGIDDARNIAKIFNQHFGKWDFTR